MVKVKESPGAALFEQRARDSAPAPRERLPHARPEDDSFRAACGNGAWKSCSIGAVPRRAVPAVGPAAQVISNVTLRAVSI
jgi:hypothetical protein